jgi:hypothetical protein
LIALRALGRLVGLPRPLDRDEHQADRHHDREAGDREHPGRTLLRDVGAPQLHLLLQPLLLEGSLLALALGSLGGLDAHARFTFGVLACGLDLELRVALGADLRFLFVAAATLGVLLRLEAGLLCRANRALLFLDAVLLDLTELAEREQHRIFTLLGLGHERPLFPQ